MLGGAPKSQTRSIKGGQTLQECMILIYPHSLFIHVVVIVVVVFQACIYRMLLIRSIVQCYRIFTMVAVLFLFDSLIILITV